MKTCILEKKFWFLNVYCSNIYKITRWLEILISIEMKAEITALSNKIFENFVLK